MKARYAGVLPILLSALMLGCFTYVPAEVEAVPLGTRVRARLTPTGAQAFSTRTGMERETVNGTLVEKRGNSIVFLVRSVSGFQSSSSLDNLYQQIDVPRQDIMLVERKKVHPVKTGVAIAGGMGTLGFFLYRALKAEPSTRVPVPPDGPADNISAAFLLVRFFLPH